jgi:nitrogen regulatory protein P-II 1
MVKVQATFREEHFGSIVERLVLIGVRGLTVMPAHRGEPSEAQRLVFRGGAYRPPFVPKVMLEWYGVDKDADAVVRAIVHACAGGVLGDGRIVIQPVEEAIRIRTGERGVGAV